MRFCWYRGPSRRLRLIGMPCAFSRKLGYADAPSSAGRLLRQRLVESGWRDQLKAECKSAYAYALPCHPPGTPVVFAPSLLGYIL